MLSLSRSAFPRSLSSDVHLTNVAIQKKGDDYDAESGGKWDVRSLKLYLMAKYGAERVNTLFFNIQLICIRSLLSVQKVIISDKHSFEMYGYGQSRNDRG
jgi:tubulin polyglutamylase TTLL9